MKTRRRGERLKVKIDRLSIGGRGVARAEGLVIFIPLSAPGDELEIELTTVKKSFAEGRIIRIEKPGSSRITPPCPVAGVCGGCSWQQIEYSEQLKQKKSLVAEALRKFSGFALEANSVSETIASPKTFRYRNRIQLHHSGPHMGFFKRGSHDIVDINDCPITDERLAQLIPETKRIMAHEKAGRIELFLSIDEKANRRKLGGESNDGESEFEQATGPAFSQVNTEQNRALIDGVIDALKECSGHLLELYAGSGNFTFPISEKYPLMKVCAVEINRSAVEAARERLNGPASGQIEFVCEDVGAFIAKTDDLEDSIVLLDPPRTGCGVAVMSEIARRKPAQVVYVSCHPATLARDLKVLSENGYELLKVQPYDMFPQTDHVETLIVARLKG